MRPTLLMRFAPLTLAGLASAITWGAGPDAGPNTSPTDQGVPAAQERLLYIGTYTTNSTAAMPSKGIYTMRLNLATGALSAPQLAAETVNPSFLALHPSQRRLYAVNEVGDYKGAKTGSVSAFSIDDAGVLRPLNDAASGGSGPCYISLDRRGTHAFIANYGDGSIAVLPLNPANGALGKATTVVQHTGSSVNKQRQAGPHAHSLDLDPSGRFAIGADLGLDKLLVYRFDAKTGGLTPNDPPSASVAPGAGPRHVAFHPNGRYAYVINEIDNTITAFTWDGTRGVLTTLQTIGTVPEGFTETTNTAEIHVHPSGRFLYGSNRGHDSIAMYTIDEKTGRLTLLGYEPTGGKTPRFFGIDPGGAWLLAGNQRSDSIAVFEIDTKTGRLTKTGEPTPVPMPVHIAFVTHQDGAPGSGTVR